jgi:SAM-dependent methyltransferase
MAAERDYVLGTHEEELARLGLQHHVWRSVALDCWQRAGITVGKRVLDVGAGPGYAAIDLAEIVGATGEVVALERSQNFIRAMESTCRARSLANVKVHELDLMQGELPKGDYDLQPDSDRWVPFCAGCPQWKAHRSVSFLTPIQKGHCIDGQGQRRHPGS